MSPHYTDEEKQQMNAIRSKFDELEAAIRDCVWMPPEEQRGVLDDMSAVREHMNRGRTFPTIKMFFGSLFFASPHWGIDEMMAQVKRAVPDSPMVAEQVSKQLRARIAAGMLNQIDDSDKVVPDNLALPPSHPDRTDPFGYPLYWPTDAEGFPIANFDRERIAPSGLGVRRRFGVCPSIQDADGKTFKRMKLPTPTCYAEQMHARELEQLKREKRE